MFLPTPGKPDEDTPSNPKEEKQKTASDPQHLDDDIYVWALERLLHGDKPSQLRKSLCNEGYTVAQADEILQAAIKFRNEHKTEEAETAEPQGGALALTGCGIAVFGLVATIASMSLTAATGGGTYVAFTGLMVAGGLMFLRGIFSRGSNS